MLGTKQRGEASPARAGVKTSCFDSFLAVRRSLGHHHLRYSKGCRPCGNPRPASLAPQAAESIKSAPSPYAPRICLCSVRGKPFFAADRRPFSLSLSLPFRRPQSALEEERGEAAAAPGGAGSVGRKRRRPHISAKRRNVEHRASHALLPKPFFPPPPPRSAGPVPKTERFTFRAF